MRTSTINRKTAETDISLTLNLDGELSPTEEARFEVLPGGLTVLSPGV